MERARSFPGHISLVGIAVSILALRFSFENFSTSTMAIGPCPFTTREEFGSKTEEADGKMVFGRGPDGPDRTEDGSQTESPHQKEREGRKEGRAEGQTLRTNKRDQRLTAALSTGFFRWAPKYHPLHNFCVLRSWSDTCQKIQNYEKRHVSI